MALSATSDALPRIGELIDGKYRLESLLGQGGMGAVFRATHAHTGRTVAVKMIVPAFATDESFLRRFEREARAAGSLRHPNIVDVTDFGYAQTDRGRLAYLVMEFLDGCSLADVLRQQSGLPLAWSVDVIEQVGLAVEEAHRAGLLHRDLKPDNIWLEPNRKGGYSVKVLDFGLAKLASGSDAPVPRDGASRRSPAASVPGAGEAGNASADSEVETRLRPAPPAPPEFDEHAPTTARPGPAGGSGATAAGETEGATAFGAIVGTPAYMSPEQCRGLPLTPASDVYSLGVIAYRMLAGRLPFEGGSDAQIRAHIESTPPDIGALRRDLPPDACALLNSSLAKDPSVRPRSAGAFASMLSAQVQPTPEFLRSGFFLFIQHLRPFLEASAYWMSPALGLAALAALLGIVEAAGWRTPLPAIPEEAFIIVPQILAVLGIFALQGAMVPAVMQAIVAPLQPLDFRSLQRAFRGRMRSYLQGILPLIAMMVAFFVWVLVLVLWVPDLMEPIRPVLRTLPRALAVVLMMAVLLPLMVGPLMLFRRSALGSALQFLGPVTMMEGLLGKAALARSARLALASGRALKAIMVASFAIGALVGLSIALLSLTIPRELPDWARVAVQAPLLVMSMALLAPFLSVVSALTYLRAIKAAGESPDDVLRQFEREILPPSHWKLAARERILTQIDATRA